MNCLKCGQEISSEQVFCDACLTDMEKHPVKPGTPVIIPKQAKTLPSKRSHRKIPKPEEQLAMLKRVISWLVALVVLLAVSVGLLTAAVLHFKALAEDTAGAPQAAPEIVSRETIFDNI